jgi:hypothetical protein
MNIETFNEYNEEYIKNAKSISFKSYRLLKSKETGNDIMSSWGVDYTLNFDKNGKLMSVISDRSITTKLALCIYNFDNRLSCVVEYFLDSNHLSSIFKFEYDEDGRLIREIESSDYQIENERTYTYLPKIVQIKEYNTDGEKHNLYEFIYDSKRREIEKKVITLENKDYEEPEELGYWLRLEYDDKENVVREVSYSESEEVEQITENIYNKNGLLMKSIVSDNEGDHVTLHEYVYDKNELWSQVKTIQTDGRITFSERSIEYY